MNARLSRPLGLAVLLLVAVTFAVAGVPRSAGAADAGWLGEYYANPWLMGPAALIREDPDINFNWGAGSPAPQIPPDNFSIRWTRTLTLDAGRYRFTTTTDDGVRLFLDGALIIDQWHKQMATSYSAERDLGAGQHSLRMEYFEAAGDASARLTWERANPPPPPPPPNAWRGEYFNNPWLQGPPAMVRDDPEINFDWGNGSPAPQIPADNFSVRWTRTLTFDGGRYRFTTTTDDGVRLYLDGQLIIDQWHGQPPTSYSAERDLSPGQHSLRMEYYEATGGAMARLSWTGGSPPPPPPPPTGPWHGEYYANPSLSGWPALVRDDAAINFDWGLGSPAPQIPPDNFSVRWTRTITFEGGRYRFTTTTDDGVRLYLDGRLIIDQWHNQPATSYSAERDLSSGQHSLRMEYYEALNLAVARLTWTRVNPPPPTAPWTGEYFANPWLQGPPALVRKDAAINFDWGYGSPAPQIPPDNFSVRWTRTANFGGGRYRFKTTTDDGVRLYVDGRLVINRWYDMGPTTFTVDLNLSAGNHSVRMEYYEHLGKAIAKLSWEKLGSNEKPPPVGNIITCAAPGNSWVRVYRLENGNWVDTNPKGYGPIGPSGRMKLDGFQVDTDRYGGAGQPYRVEVWTNGVRVRSVGNTAVGEPEFRVRAWADNYTPWGCP